MNDLLQSQIRESCNLALPEGLKDLMSDISREVLRAQPQNVYKFIANYLESLLEVREALTIACHICNEGCECTCDSELRSELSGIGLDEEDLDKAVMIIQEHLGSGSVNEPSLFIKLTKKIDIDEFYMPFIQEAIQRAFKRQYLENVKTKYLQKDHYDEAKTAVQHTMQVYEIKTKSNQSNISMDLKPCVNVFSRSSSETYEATPEFETDDFKPNNDEFHTISPNTSIETEFDKIADEGMNSEVNDVQSKEKCTSNDDNYKCADEYDSDEVNSSSLKVDVCVTEIENINEEIDNESENESILSLINESLSNMDDIIDEEL